MSIDVQSEIGSSAALRYDWTREEIAAVYDMPLMELIYRAATVHRQFHDPGEVQVCRLVSIKTGGCPEDCKYCSQSAHYETEISASPLMEKQRVMEIAAKAKTTGVTRLCMGAAWRQVKDGEQFDRVLDMVKSITDTGLEVCCTLGMLTESQAKQLEAAGLYAYNHNIDTSPEYYETIITTRTFADRLQTLENVRKTNITVCCGGILGLGESRGDRISMLESLANMNPHPESVPINILSKVAGTPMEKNAEVPVWETVRVIATARIVMPGSMVRLSAGRSNMSLSDQAMCFMAGANSIFSSDERIMLTRSAASQDYDQDKAMLDILGLNRRPPFKE
ncbi:MAG TPA: biotin synthase BioB [Tepidisphaeraceae bacterium]